SQSCGDRQQRTLLSHRSYAAADRHGDPISRRPKNCGGRERRCHIEPQTPLAAPHRKLLRPPQCQPHIAHPGPNNITTHASSHWLLAESTCPLGEPQDAEGINGRLITLLPEQSRLPLQADKTILAAP